MTMTVAVLVCCAFCCEARPPPMSPGLTGCTVTREMGLNSSRPVYKTKYLVRKADFVAKLKVTGFLDELKYEAEVKVLAVYKDSTGRQIKVGDQLSLVDVNSPLTCTRNRVLSDKGSKGLVFAKKIQGSDDGRLQLMTFGVQEVVKL